MFCASCQIVALLHIRFGVVPWDVSSQLSFLMVTWWLLAAREWQLTPGYRAVDVSIYRSRSRGRHVAPAPAIWQHGFNPRPCHCWLACRSFTVTILLQTEVLQVLTSAGYLCRSPDTCVSRRLLNVLKYWSRKYFSCHFISEKYH